MAALTTLCMNAHAASEDLLRLKDAYPEYIQEISEQAIVWVDGSTMAVHDDKPDKTQQEKLENPALCDQVSRVYYTDELPPIGDPGRIRYEPFFKKMYGDSKEAVEANLTVVYWLPKYFGERYPLLVTMINGVDEKLKHISDELEVLVALHPDYLPYLDNPGGTFEWRVIANTHRLSPHSFGMTIDINSTLSNYWQWDLQKAGLPVNEETPLTYINSIPLLIVPIFEKYGFIWGGKWYHYDSMHFEYRPELLV